MLTLKHLSPTRMVKNEFYNQVVEAERRGASVEEIRELLGRGRAKLGIFEGNLVDGELEIGQGAALLKKVQSAKDVIYDLITYYNIAKAKITATNEE